MTNDTIIESRLLAEETVRPISAVVPLILWAVALFLPGSMIVEFFQPVPAFLPGWCRVGDFFVIIFVSVITWAMAVLITVIYITFTGVRYRIFTDRIEYQRGKNLHFVPLQKMSFGDWQTLDFNGLHSIEWKVEEIAGENPSDTTFIEFHFLSRSLQLHKSFDLSGQVAESCRTIERETIAPRILQSLQDGENAMFKCPEKYEVAIDDKGIRDGNQHAFSWNEICKIGFSKGKTSGYSGFLVQSRICIKNIAGETMEFDMPKYNPHAFWAVITNRCNLPTLQIVDFPKKERTVS